MSISLKNMVGGGAGIELGECVMLHDQPEPLLELDGMEFLKSGNALTNEEAAYPEAFEKFGISSLKGETWIPIDLSGILADDLIKVIAVAGGFIGLTAYRSLVKSTDGITWTAQSTGLNVNWVSIAYGNGIYVIVGAMGKLATSDDGITWTSRTSSFGSTRIVDITFGKGIFVAIGVSNGSVASSPDGINWTQRTHAGGNGRKCVEYIDFLDIFIIGANGGGMQTSSDGITWATTGNLPGSTNGISSSDNLLVAVGGSGHLHTSVDAVTWTERTSGFGLSDVNAVIYVSGLWAIGSGNGQIATSADGITWAPVSANVGSVAIMDFAAIEGILVGFPKARNLTVSLSTAVLGLPTETKDGQSTQYMRVK